MSRLANKIAVVSGGASGIGQAAALRLASEGAIVEIIDKDDAGLVCSAIDMAGGTAARTVCDLTDNAQVAAAVGAIEERRDRVDILFNNAGILAERKPWHEKTIDEITNFVNVNYTSVFTLTKAVYPLLCRSGSGRIIMASSRTAFLGNPGMAGYVESKAAVAGFARLLARELGPDAITVNAIAPGMIATQGTRTHSDDEMFERATAMQAIKLRLEPEHVAGLVAFLASEDAAMITGQTIVVDGGGFLH
jgi:NAD(P)-dependent dehydrogenase (short-subunit alcohol dehydrogenase family)